MLTNVPENQLQRLLKSELGSAVELISYQIGNQHPDYLVLIVQIQNPTQTVVVKLAGPQAEYDCPFEKTAVLHHQLNQKTSLTMPKIYAADVSYQKWPWRYTIKEHVQGIEFVHIREQLNSEQLSVAYHQMGEAVAQIHALAFPAFGALDDKLKLQHPLPWLQALQNRAKQMIRNQRLRNIFLSVLDKSNDLFPQDLKASLCHDDLHGYNILFQQEGNQWRLSAILDFEKAWAGHAETDLAKMDLWTEMTSDDFWQAYLANASLDDQYLQRQPIYQLLWCLEYAQPTPKHLSDTQTLCHKLGIAPIHTFD